MQVEPVRPGYGRPQVGRYTGLVDEAMGELAVLVALALVAAIYFLPSMIAGFGHKGNPPPYAR